MRRGGGHLRRDCGSSVGFCLTSLCNYAIILRICIIMNIIPRTAASKVLSLSTQFPCVLVTGARQVGKSTLLRSIMPQGMRYITMDDYRLVQQAQEDPIGLLEEYGTPLCIEEVQYAPELFRAIKLKVDADRRPGMYWLTGSQRFLMMKGITESLAGRVGILELQTLSQRELLRKGESAAPVSADTFTGNSDITLCCDIQQLYERIHRGGYPALHENPALNLNDYFTSYLQTYIQRDVHALIQISDHISFARFIQSAAARSGQQLIYADLARDADVSPNTAKNWISILEASGIISLLRPYYINCSKRLTKSPKLYFCDTGLCAWLGGWTDPNVLRKGAFAGSILETWVFNQLARSYIHAGQQPPMFYYRDSSGAEVDFLLCRNGHILPIEVKKSDSPSASDLNAISKIPVGTDTIAPGVVLCTAQSSLPLGYGHRSFPISAL